MTETESRGRILVVDDTELIRTQLRELLETAGYSVVAVGVDGEEGLELYERHDPDLVTMDLVMPRKTGLEALRELRLRHPDARVVVCSSLTDQASIFQAIASGARDYVLKPINPQRLLDAVEKALKGRA